MLRAYIVRGARFRPLLKGGGVEDVLCTGVPVSVVVQAIGCRVLLIDQVTKPIAPSQAVAFSLPVALAHSKVTTVEANALQLLPDVHQPGNYQLLSW
jgi:hypothetical protein